MRNSRARRCWISPRPKAECISGSNQCLRGNESGFQDSCAPMVPTTPLFLNPGACHGPPALLPSPGGLSAQVWFGVRLPGQQLLPVAAPLRQGWGSPVQADNLFYSAAAFLSAGSCWALEAPQALCLTVAPGSNHFRERARFSISTRRTRDPAFRGSALEQRLVSASYRPG